MTAQSLLVVLQEKKRGIEDRILERCGRMDNTQYTMQLIHEAHVVEDAIRVIEEVLSVTRETRKEFGDPTLESEGEVGLGSSTPS